jgi:hypothetical protein
VRRFIALGPTAPIAFHTAIRQYGSIKMKPPKRWFCSEEEAQAAGWRRARY